MSIVGEGSMRTHTETRPRPRCETTISSCITFIFFPQHLDLTYDAQMSRFTTKTRAIDGVVNGGGGIPSLLATDHPNTSSITLFVCVFCTPSYLLRLQPHVGCISRLTRMGPKRSLIGVDLALAQINHFIHLGCNRSLSSAVNIRHY